MSSEEIKKVTLQHCVDTLKNNEPVKEVKEATELKKKLNSMRMEDKSDNGFDLTKGDFTEDLKKFKLKKTKSYDFLIKSGIKYQDSIFNFCKKMIEEEEFPDDFALTILHMIWKQKGSAAILGNTEGRYFKSIKHRSIWGTTRSFT